MIVRSAEFGVRSKSIKALILVLLLALPVWAGNNPYPKTGAETDRELLGKHEKAINNIYDGSPTLVNINSTGTATFNVISRTTGTAVVTNLNADRLDSLHASELPGALVWDHLVSGASVTSVTTNGEVALAGLAHGGYRYEFTIYNPAGGAVDYRLYVNNDTTNTDYYYWQYFFGGAGSGNTGATNDAKIVNSIAASTTTFITGDIMIGTDGTVAVNGVSAQTNSFGYVIGWRKTAVVADLTRIDITGPAGKIDVNSRFRLWRKK